ncbi:MAG: DegV family protein [Eubacterium sp.]
MSSFAIVTDSTSNLPKAFIKKHKIYVLPLTWIVGDREYSGRLDGGKEAYALFYDVLRKEKNISTSMVNQRDAKNLVQKLLAEGKDLLYIGLSSKLSGTFHMMERVLNSESKKYPERKCYAVDSLAIGLGEGSLVFDAVRIRKRGDGIGVAYAWCCQRRWRLTTLFTVDDLGFLRRSGRAGAILSTAGSVLKIKVLFSMKDGGKLRQEGKVRGRKKALQELTTLALTSLTEPQTVYISHGDCHDDACYVAKQLEKSEFVKKIIMQTLDPVSACHTGPNSIGIFFV